MASPAILTTTRTEDLLAHLPTRRTTEYAKGQTIYGAQACSDSIYLVVEGKVAISQVAENGREILLEIVPPEELFGESAFLDTPLRAERAVAIEDTQVMTWAISDIEDLVTKRPRLAVALLQVLAQRNAEFSRRIESFSIDSIERRLARSLLRLSQRLGTAAPDGTVMMMPISQTLLSQYVGTSREIVSHYMNRFRRLGHVSYSRRGIVIYQDSFQAMLYGAGFPAAEPGS